MNIRKSIPTAIAASLLTVTAFAPAAMAGDAHKDSQKSEMSQHTNAFEAEVKDAWLQGKLETALLFNEHLNSFAIDTEVKSGKAYLSGYVESEIDVDLAGEIAESIDGVTDVENDLKVDEAKSSVAREGEQFTNKQSFRQTVMDATHSANINTQLLLNDNTSGTAIDVDTENGVVTLTGEVSSDEERELAGMIAKNADGTKSVKNKLTVKKVAKAS
jgi:osmotically-inducible protein OsmY